MPGRMGRPEAVADVQPSGRGVPDTRSNIAPEPAVKPPLPSALVRYVSYKRQSAWESTVAWRSEFASMGRFCGNGYGPGSLWAAKENVIGAPACEAGTTRNGWP